MKWVSEMENVIFTTKKEEFKEFAALKMNVVNVLKFIEKIRGPYERQSGCKFNINEKELLHFPNCENIKYYDSYNYRNPLMSFASKIFSKLFG